MKQVLIRADSGRHIGSGHIMRCLTIAKLLKKLGAEVTFCCRNHIGHQSDVLRAFPLVMLSEPEEYTQEHGDYPHSHWLGCTEEKDAEQTIRELTLAGIKPDWVIVDHFSLGAIWEQKLTSETHARALVIDGLRDRPHECQLLIDPTLNKRSATPGEGQVLFGPWHIPLREEFTEINPKRRTELNKVFVCFGGVDKDDITGQVCDVLTKPSFRNKLEKVDVVVGASYPHIERLSALCQQYSGYLNLEVQSTRISKLMADADLAIGAGGGISWERCAAALPALCWTIADNQTVPNEQLASLNAIIHLGKVSENLTHELESKMALLFAQPEILSAMSASAKKVMLGWDKKNTWMTQILN
ncbi:UDP-2,4-diacetamido-2,4,6-trideoxy-beta-L-altropyranose hydrolase [Shewanella japonica]|uniref:UDP-2,4-diacetamido-2,4, 6-trideoxy-beta-L-altropyranose hydrolase n=1 Tax=Shewanella japonica TaxID=93973 RepID=UPI00249542E1|nr:UDP-2,4-diacetamido-2,4,6-trideoxy-beta-L-altropyranose hydrolase [Shewanella japonica]